MIVKDFSDELIALYEDTEDAEETITSEEVVKTVLAAPDLKTAYKLLLNKAESDSAVDEIAKKISYDGVRYSILFEDLEKVYGMSIDNTPGLLEFWTVIKLMVESKSEWSGGKLTGNWTHRLVNSFYKPALTEAGIFKVLQNNNFSSYKFEFSNSIGLADEHARFFSGPGENTPDFNSNEGTVECKPEGTKSNFHNASYILRYKVLYKDKALGKFWFEPNVKRNLPPKFPATKDTAESFEIGTFSGEGIILDDKKLTSIYEDLCKIATSQLQQTLEQDHDTLKDKVEDQLKEVDKLEKEYFVDTNHSLKNVPSDFNVATKQLNTLINRKAEVATLLSKSAQVQAEGFMKTYEELNTLN